MLVLKLYAYRLSIFPAATAAAIPKLRSLLSRTLGLYVHSISAFNINVFRLLVSIAAQELCLHRHDKAPHDPPICFAQ